MRGHRGAEEPGVPAKDGIVVAIDGPAGAGKSTLGLGLARSLGLPMVNTGLMYRALAERALRSGVSPDDEAGLERLAAAIRFSLARRRGGPLGELRIDGRVPRAALRSPQVEAVVSRVARHPGVRRLMRRRQRELGVRGSVMEGRDIGTVVFPDADLKFFLSAPTTVRAQRRTAERDGRVQAGDPVAGRDALDARTTPLVPAADAHVLDTSRLDERQALEVALGLAREVVGRGANA